MVLSETPPPAVLEAFTFEGRCMTSARLGGGHINASFVLTTNEVRRYVLQRINAHVFSQPADVMHNIDAVLSHLAVAHPQTERLRLIPTHAGASAHIEPDGETWRAYDFVPNSVSLTVPRGPEDAWQAAHHFARFGAMLADYAGPPLRVTIGDFHDTPRRLLDLIEASLVDPRERLANCRDLFEAYLGMREHGEVLLAAHQRGVLSLRPVHNDAKLSNLLLDADTGAGRCVVDLDTLMPGLALYDLGDLLRSASCHAPEDCEDPREMVADPELLAALLEGWRSGLGDAASEPELALMLPAGVTLTLECGARFLTDYLRGDRYFAVDHEDHNLIRARAQLALAQDLLARARA